MDWILAGSLLDQSAAHPLCQYDQGCTMVLMGDMELKELKDSIHPYSCC